MGVSRVFQTPEIFSELSVWENTLIPCFAKRDGAFTLNALGNVADNRDVAERAEHMLVDVDLSRQTRHAGSMRCHVVTNVAWRWRCVCHKNPKRIVVWMNQRRAWHVQIPNNTIDCSNNSRDERDITIAIIEHDMHVVFSLAERITVLAQGTPIVEDTTRQHQRPPQRCAKRTLARAQV